MKKGLMLILTGGLLLAACASSGNTPTRTQVATRAATAAPNTSVATDTSGATAQPTPVPATATTLPTPTEAATATAQPTEQGAQPSGTFEIGLRPVVQGGLTRPTALTHAGDDRLFVLEQPGEIRIIENGQLLDQPFLEIASKVSTVGTERGLLGLAFHPDYSTNGQLFVDYTRKADGATLIERYTVSSDDPNRADDKSGKVILTIAQPEPNHNGGQLAFGPDGYLYIGMGDGGGAGDRHGSIGNGQDRDALLGKILRLDVTNQDTYAVPQDNPFGTEVWAYGLRNPWRFSFDRAMHDLYIADVGQGNYEEVDFQPAASQGGENYGWRIMEGKHCFDPSQDCNQSGLVLPVAEYTHAEGGCSVTGGYVYRGQQFPVLQGAYVFGDYCTGYIWSLQRDGDEWPMTKRLEAGVRISSFGEDVNGELYVVAHNGAVYQLIAQ